MSRRSSARAFAVELPPDGIDLLAELERTKEAYIEEALRRTGGNMARASALLGLSRAAVQVRRFRRKRR